MVLDEIPEDCVIYDHSQETYIFDKEGACIIHEETVGTDPDSGVPEAILNSRRFLTL